MSNYFVFLWPFTAVEKTIKHQKITFLQTRALQTSKTFQMKEYFVHNSPQKMSQRISTFMWELVQINPFIFYICYGFSSLLSLSENENIHSSEIRGLCSS